MQVMVSREYFILQFLKIICVFYECSFNKNKTKTANRRAREHTRTHTAAAADNKTRKKMSMKQWCSQIKYVCTQHIIIISTNMKYKNGYGS